jgi:ABC-type polysaccharide transport system permease subunit
MAVSLFQSLVGFMMVYGSNALVRRYDKSAALF